MIRDWPYDPRRYTTTMPTTTTNTQNQHHHLNSLPSQIYVHVPARPFGVKYQVMTLTLLWYENPLYYHTNKDSRPQLLSLTSRVCIHPQLLSLTSRVCIHPPNQGRRNADGLSAYLTRVLGPTVRGHSEDCIGLRLLSGETGTDDVRNTHSSYFPTLIISAKFS